MWSALVGIPMRIWSFCVGSLCNLMSTWIKFVIRVKCSSYVEISFGLPSLSQTNVIVVDDALHLGLSCFFMISWPIRTTFRVNLGLSSGLTSGPDGTLARYFSTPIRQ